MTWGAPEVEESFLGLQVMPESPPKELVLNGKDDMCAPWGSRHLARMPRT